MPFFDIPFWQNFVSNALATFVGAVIGIPIALWLSKHQELASEKERKKKILSLLQEELIINLSVVSGLKKKENKEIEYSIIGPFLRDESWNAFSDGGELEWIKDPKLLSELANAYDYIKSFRQLSQRYFEIRFMTSEFNVFTIPLEEELKRLTEKGVSETEEMIASALKAINDK